MEGRIDTMPGWAIRRRRAMRPRVRGLKEQHPEWDAKRIAAAVNKEFKYQYRPIDVRTVYNWLKPDPAGVA